MCSYPHPVVLTDSDHLLLSSYRHLISSLGEYLGEGYELILHSLENLDSSVIAIVNGHYSGRSEGAPITDLALTILSQIEQDPGHSPICYMTRSKNGIPLRSATIPIFGTQEKIIGLLCINFYTNIPLYALLDKFALGSQNPPGRHMELEETFSSNTDELIESIVDKVRRQVLSNSSISAQNKNKEIVIELHQKGIFNIKDAVVKVADLLGISKNTVYMHIRNLKEDTSPKLPPQA